MRSARCYLSFGAALLAALLVGASGGPARAGPGVAGVIIASVSTGESIMFSGADGGGPVVLPYDGPDATHSGPWELLYRKPAPNGNPELFASGPGGEVPLTDDATLRIHLYRWSISGARISWTAGRADGTEWLYVAEVTRIAGNVARLSGIRPVLQLNGATTISWASDDHRIAITMPVPIPGSVQTQSDVFVVDVETGTLRRVTSTPSVNEYHPAFSPRAERIAFVRRTNKAGSYRNDIFVLDPSTGRTAQVTSKSNANLAQILLPAWSPDGTAIAFGAYTLSLAGPSGIYRLAADGSGKALRVSPADGRSYSNPRWRLGPGQR